MKILLFCDGNYNQKALAHKIHNRFGLYKIVVKKPSNNITKNINSKKLIKVFLKIFFNVLTLFKFRKVWFGMLSFYKKKYAKFPISPELFVSDINDFKVEKLVVDSNPDLIIVSGTNLLREKLISKISIYCKVMNLHTGISPYIKGGPDCTNWCFFLKEFNLIGNTIMWIDKGIDSGNIISTEQTSLTGEESLIEIKIKSMEHGHDLLLRVIDRFCKKILLPNVSQNTLKPHRLFLTKDWGLKEQIIALFNYYFHFSPKKIRKTKKRLIPLTPL